MNVRSQNGVSGGANNSQMRPFSQVPYISSQTAEDFKKLEKGVRQNQ